MDVVIFERRKIPSSPMIPKTREEFCIGCGVCAKVCPVKDVNEIVEEEVMPGVFLRVVEVPPSKEEMKVALEGGETCKLSDFCIRCRKCVDECPADARVFLEEE